jgi:multicomponent Na+:H+ antiporter subunit D
VSSAAEDHRIAIFLMLTLASAGTFLSTTLKLPYAAFFGEDRGIKATDPPKSMQVGMGLAAFLCILLGIVPGLLYGLLPFNVAYHPFTAQHLSESLQLLAMTLLGFLILLPKLHPEAKISLDRDWFYRKFGRGFAWFAQNPLNRADVALNEAYEPAVMRPTARMADAAGRFDRNVIDAAVNGLAAAVLASAQQLRLMQTGQMQRYALVMAVGLFAILSLYLLY